MLGCIASATILLLALLARADEVGSAVIIAVLEARGLLAAAALSYTVALASLTVPIA